MFLQSYDIMDFNSLRYLLGKPYFESENCIIYNAECNFLMKKLGASLIDLTITSPPYNIGKEYETKLPVEDYIKWCESWMSEIYRLTKYSGAFWLNIGYLSIPQEGNAVPISYLIWNKTQFYLMQEIVWNYGAGVACKRFFSPRNEKLLWYVKDSTRYVFNLDDVRDKNVKYPNQKKNGKLKCNPNGKNPTDVWQIPKVTSGKNRSSKERTPHPAQFPLELIQRIVKACSNTNNLIMDPFLGSGTTAIAALQNRRKFIGFEIEESYCKVAITRIENFIETQKQQNLFCRI